MDLTGPLDGPGRSHLPEAHTTAPTESAQQAETNHTTTTTTTTILTPKLLPTSSSQEHHPASQDCASISLLAKSAFYIFPPPPSSAVGERTLHGLTFSHCRTPTRFQEAQIAEPQHGISPPTSFHIVSETERVSPVHLAQASSPFFLHPRGADLPSWGYTVPRSHHQTNDIAESHLVFLPRSNRLVFFSAYVVDALLWEWLPFHTLQTASFEPRKLETVLKPSSSPCLRNPSSSVKLSQPYSQTSTYTHPLSNRTCPLSYPISSQACLLLRPACHTLD